MWGLHALSSLNRAPFFTPSQPTKQNSSLLIQFRSNLMPHIALVTHTILLTQRSNVPIHKLHPLALPHISLLAPLPNHPSLPLIITIKLRIQRFSKRLDIPKVMHNPITLANGIFSSAASPVRRRVQNFPGMGALPGLASFEDDEEGV
jgi:hypothetical protein